MEMMVNAEKKNQNVVKLVGRMVKIHKVWSSIEHTTYEGNLEVLRESGTIDYIPILIKDLIIEKDMEDITTNGLLVEITG